MHSGNFVIVLHTHLPYVLNHGTWPHGTDWVCEAVAECYIPLLNAFNELIEVGIMPKVTIDISPVLCEQLESPTFAKVFEQYCTNKFKLAAADATYFRRNRFDSYMVKLAGFWQQWFANRKLEFIEKYNRSIISELRRLQDLGAIEIMTCGATHGYFPLLAEDASIRLQIQAACANYEKHFGRTPRGIWLPECAYRPAYPWQTYLPVKEYNQMRQRPGTEELLAEFGLKYFVVDQQVTAGGTMIGVLDESGNAMRADARTHPRLSSYAKTPFAVYNVRSVASQSGGMAAAFTRNQDVAMQVWSGDMGYPGDPVYLDFHKKHFNSALRYWRVTDNKADMMYKLLYVPEWIQEKVDIHAYHFTKSVETALTNNVAKTGRIGMVCTPFDTELFGHWWFEGPDFVKAVLKGMHASPYVTTVTASEHLNMAKPKAIMAVPEGSWGKGGHHDVWIGPEAKWTWQILYSDELRMRKLLENYPKEKRSAIQERILKQAMRELMLLSASDWQFLISTMSAKDYAEQRFSFHHSDFNKLCDLFELYAKKKKIAKSDESALAEIEKRNAVFMELNPDWFQEQPNLKVSATTIEKESGPEEDSNGASSSSAETPVE